MSKLKSTWQIYKAVIFYMLFLCVCVLLLFLNSLTVPDFTPNVGLFWYFFTEMFEHFRLFFLCVFQMNMFIHCIPLTIKFRYISNHVFTTAPAVIFSYSKHPMFLVYVFLSLISLFKSYPTVSDITVPLALLPLWTHIFRCTL